MRSFRLNFWQQIWLGFGVIILLLSVSSALSLFNLFDIIINDLLDKKNTAVNNLDPIVQLLCNEVEIKFDFWLAHPKTGKNSPK